MFKSFLKQFVPLPTPEEWAEHNARKTSADEIIVANILQSFVSHFDDWSVVGSISLPDAKYMPVGAKEYDGKSYSVVFIRERINGSFAKKIEVRLRYHIKRWSQVKNHCFNYGLYGFDPEQLEINGVPCDLSFVFRIINDYKKLADTIQKTREVAAKAKRDMELNEKRWDLVESLFGMKRTGTGVLTTVETAT